mmetsp:Transcript_22806/g.52133  ORF Transcript_22806/g.52133 Transcript_22806/m.52133 type:complete len:723 (+) Transcript_22806:85-2253(+)
MGNSDSHASFVDGVKRLLAEDVKEADADFWAALFSAPMSIEDVFEIIGPEHVRQLRQKRPRNLQTFLRQIVVSVGAVCSTMEKGDKTEMSPAMTTTVCTATRLLTRTMPFLLEASDDATVLEILWRPGGMQVAQEEASATSSADQGKEAVEQAVLAHNILNCILRLLFLPQFTVTPRGPPAEKALGAKLPRDKVDARVVWKGGVGVSVELPTKSSQVQHKNRAEVLRCLLACLSGPLFQTADEYQEKPSPWLVNCTGGQVAHTANLFVSLLSTVMSYDPVGWGLPYGGYFSSGSEEELVDVCLQVLCVLMDFDSEIYGEIEDETTGEMKKRQNVYRFMLKNVHKDHEIDLIFTGITGLLSTTYQANHTYLPNSFRSVGFYQESLVLLWHLVTYNQKFLRRVVDHLDTNLILLPVLYLLQQSQSSPQLVGLLHTASFVLLILSSERPFSVRLNDPYVKKLPLILPSFKGNHADVLALVLYKVISDSFTNPQNDALVEMLLTVLCNVSPYVKAFSLESCLKLLSLVERSSRPAYLFRSPFTHHGLVFLIEMMNNIIQYQYEGNTMLVYSILRQKEVFRNLKNLKVAGKSGNAESSGQDDSDEDDDEADDDEGGNWTPTDKWLQGWKKKLPIQALDCLIDFLAPQVEALCKQNDVTDQDEVIRYLQRQTMVGILPVPHAIVIRTYQASSYTSMWFTSYMWGVIFTRSQRLPLYDWKQIRLVVINQ